MSHKEQLLSALEPIFGEIESGPVEDASRTKAALDAAFPVGSSKLEAIAKVLRAGIAAGELCDRENGGVRFSRLLKPTDDRPWSIDLVHMNGPGPGHTHPGGEIDLCFAVDGDPTFDGNGVGFTVYDAGSWHTPTVKGGSMDIIYFLPDGAIKFESKPV